LIRTLIVKVLNSEVPLEAIRAGEYISPLLQTCFFITPLIKGTKEYRVY
jgi:hypothetical protein